MSDIVNLTQNISCFPADSGCRLPPWTLIPTEYSGWLFLIFMIVGIIVVGYGIYITCVGPQGSETESERSPDRESAGPNRAERRKQER
jgi:hypothetical protein